MIREVSGYVKYTTTNAHDNDHINADIVLPPNTLQSHRIEVIESGNTGLYKKVLRNDELGADVVGHAFDCVAGQDAIPGRGVEGAADEDEGKGCVTGALVVSCNVDGIADAGYKLAM